MTMTMIEIECTKDMDHGITTIEIDHLTEIIHITETNHGTTTKETNHKTPIKEIGPIVEIDCENTTKMTIEMTVERTTEMIIEMNIEKKIIGKIKIGNIGVDIEIIMRTQVRTER